ncbi:MAG: hypothetical protein U1F09_14835 [Steroidobacteraceae bacterium]
MRVFFDTEFTQFRDGQLLSAGFVADDGRTLYVEVDAPERRAAASDFCQLHVLSQFGLVPGSAVGSDADAGRRIADWLLGFDTSLDLYHDFKLDWMHVQQAVTAAGRWTAVEPRVRACNVAADVDQPAALDAQEAYFAARSRPGRHHALVDTHALRVRWRAAERLAAAADPDAPVVRRAQPADARRLAGSRNTRSGMRSRP